MKWLPLGLVALLSSSFANAAPLYHVKDFGTVGCSDKLIAAEIAGASKNGALSDGHFDSIFHQGHCAPFSPTVKLKIIRRETFNVPAGVQHEVLMRPLSGNNQLYFMQEDVEKVK